MELTKICIDGLDTIQSLGAFTAIGNYSIANPFSLHHITFEADLNLTIRASSLNNSSIVAGNDDVLLEMITLRSGPKMFDVDASILFALDIEKLGKI